MKKIKKPSIRVRDRDAYLPGLLYTKKNTYDSYYLPTEDSRLKQVFTAVKQTAKETAEVRAKREKKIKEAQKLSSREVNRQRRIKAKEEYISVLERRDTTLKMVRNSRFFGTVILSSVLLVFFGFMLTVGAFSPAANKVTVNDNGKLVSVVVGDMTVGEFFSKYNITLNDADICESEMNSNVTNNLEIVIRRSIPVLIKAGAEELTVNVLAGTVSDALAKIGIIIGETDDIFPPLDTPVSANMRVEITGVTTRNIVTEKILYFRELTRDDRNTPYGQSVILQEGKNGSAEVEHKITYKNGVEVGRELISSKTKVKVVDQITGIGTFLEKGEARPTPTPKPTLRKPGAPNYGRVDKYGKLLKIPSLAIIHYGDMDEHEGVAMPADAISEKAVIVASITASSVRGEIGERIGSVAADITQIPLGTRLYIPGYGYGVVEYSLQPSTDLVLQVFFNSDFEYGRFGKKLNVKCIILA